MFDDQQNNNPNSGVPSNLPVGEPDDMFASVEKEDNLAPTPSVQPEIMPAQPSSALGAGILKPKEESVPDLMIEPEIPSIHPEPQMSTMPQGDVSSAPQPMGSMSGIPTEQQVDSVHGGNSVYKIKEPALGKGIVSAVIAVVVIVVLGGGGLWIYNSFIKDSSGEVVDTVLVENDNIDNILEDVVVEEDFVDEFDFEQTNDPIVDEGTLEEVVEEGVPVDSDIVGDIIDDQILFGEPIDKDADGLDDDREIDIGTDPNNWDTDGDELGDGDEVTIWKTDPLNPDSDGDTYLDGAEVKNGYNPDGPGKLFEPPTEEDAV